MHKKTAASGKGHFGDLIDDLLWHVLSFLPVADALQTCVLDTRWRDHWRRTTSLLFIFDQSSFPSSERFKQLVKLFIHLRGNSPLDKCKIVGCLDDEEERTYTNTMLLIEYAVKCQVKELLLSVAVQEGDHGIEFDPLILDVPLISQHLKVLHLKRVDLKLSALNFSRCSVLEDLEMQHCNIDARRISSKSLKRLCITDYCSFPVEFHIRIFAPGLISLLLDFHNGLTPSLEHMPSLETADVWLGHACYHSCRSNRQDCEYDECSFHAYPVEEGVLLHGLSNAVNLKLIAGSNTEVCIYRWDLECCPIFDKLKTLSLNEWFTTIDLLCILQHSPVLEMLTLWLGSTKKFVRATGAEEKIEQSFVCSHLKVVNIDCDKVDEGVHKILKFLSTCGILRDQISLMEHCITHTSQNKCLELTKLSTSPSIHTLKTPAEERLQSTHTLKNKCPKLSREHFSSSSPRRISLWEMNPPAATMAHGESRDGPSPLLSSCGLNTVGMEGVSCSPSSSPRLPVAGASACPRVGIRTRHLLDGMPEKAAASGKDRFDGLTDDLLRHVTSFLPANDALQTCVLDTRWRDLWRRTTNLLLVFDEGCERFKQLVKLFINLRGNSPLNKCEISACPEDETDCTYTNTKLLIDYSLACQLKDLLVRKVGICNMDKPLTFDVPFISHHLKTIDLVLVNLEHSALDFSGCLVLEVLRMQGCRIRAHRMSSKSLKHLWITDLCSFPTEFHVRICAPGLISLQLDGFLGLSPFLENMPFLITAYVELGSLCSDVLYCSDHLRGL